MALLAETLVEEWLNRQRYFTIRGIKERIREIDLLGVRANGHGGATEAVHVEVQVSFRPVSYISPLTKRLQRELGKDPLSAYRRTDDQLRECVQSWVEKKFKDPRKAHRRESLWPQQSWQWILVHGAVHEPKELQLIAGEGVRLIPLQTVLHDLATRGEFVASAADQAELIELYAKHVPQA